jgi:hypothetical protein
MRRLLVIGEAEAVRRSGVWISFMIANDIFYELKLL